MLAKRSQLILENFFLLKQNIEFIPPISNDKDIDINKFTEKYDIDIDFTVRKQKLCYHVFVKIMINSNGKKIIGYSIYSEGLGIFKFDSSIENDEKLKFNYIHYSGVLISINSLRSIISNTTSYAPFGKYTMPTIDLDELIKSKAKQIINKRP
jgi:hypothetical protein